jgi:hypothetical protein
MHRRPYGPFIEATIKPGMVVNTDESVIDAALPQWGYVHQSVCHSLGEYACGEDGDGFHEVHVNTMEGLGVTSRTLGLENLSGFT